MGKSNLRGMSLNLLTININLLVIEVLGKMTKLNKHLSFLLPRAVCRHISSLLPKHLFFLHVCLHLSPHTSPFSILLCSLSHFSFHVSSCVHVHTHFFLCLLSPATIAFSYTHFSRETTGSSHWFKFWCTMGYFQPFQCCLEQVQGISLPPPTKGTPATPSYHNPDFYA